MEIQSLVPNFITMKNRYLLLTLVMAGQGLQAQTYQWTPTNTPAASYRFEDVYFLSPDTGFAVHYNDVQFGGEPGYIMKTGDGGNTWNILLDSSECYFRDVGFTDAMHGFVGTIDQHHTGADTNIIYRTLDGGQTWTGVDNLPGPDTAGICGLQVINDSTVYGVGRYFGPAGFYKTTDNGDSWSYTDLRLFAKGLVDLHFVNADTGFAIGTSGPLYNTGYARILYTTDGGANWTVQYTATHVQGLGWKISFPSRSTGYVSVQYFNFPSTEYFLKTTDGGLTWQEIAYVGGPANGYNVEGMGFLNDSTGWVGGGTNLYYTGDGGASWALETWGTNLNRFRFFGDSLGYCAGQGIYRMHMSPAGISAARERTELAGYPNPATDFVYFEFSSEKETQARLLVYNSEGKEVQVVFDRKLDAGNQHYIWHPDKLAKGIYTCVLSYDGRVLKRRLEILK